MEGEKKKINQMEGEKIKQKLNQMDGEKKENKSDGRRKK